MLRHSSWNIRNGNPEGKKVVIRVTAVGKNRTSVLAPASVARSLMGINMGSIINTGKKNLYTAYPPSAGFFSPKGKLQCTRNYILQWYADWH